MDKCKEITYCAKELLKTHKIHISDNHKDNHDHSDSLRSVLCKS